MKEKIILTDIDGVCVDWDRGFTKFAKKYFKQELHFIDEGKGKSIDGSKFVNKFGFDYEMSIWDVEINNT